MTQVSIESLRTAARMVVMLAASASLACQNSEQATTQSPLNATIDSLVADAMRDGKVPGIAVTIVRNDSVLHSRGYGFANLEKHIPMADSTPVIIGSTSKTFTAFALMQLQEQGLLSLDSSVAHYVRILGAKAPSDSTPTQTVVSKPVDRRFTQQTVRHLLTNSGGIPAGFSGDAYDAPDTMPSALERIVRDDMMPRRLDFAPGKGYKYSNRGFSLASLVVQDLGGMPYEQYVDDKIFKPLGMRHSTGYFWRGVSVPAVQGYREAVDGTPLPRPASLGREWTGSGMILSTSADIGRYLMMLLNGGKGPNGAQLLSSTGVSEIMRAQQDAESELGGPTKYGLGWEVSDMNGTKVVTKAGSVGTMGSLFLMIPDQRIGIAMVINLIDYGKVQLMQNLVKTLMGAPATPYQTAPPSDSAVRPSGYRMSPARARSVVGRYGTSAGVLVVKVDGDTIRGRYEGNDLVLEPTSETTFVMRSVLREQEGKRITIRRCSRSLCVWMGQDSIGVRAPN